MKTFCHLIGKYFGIIAVVFLILGMTVPDSFKWVVGNIGGIPVLSTLLGVIMFGMGTTLNLRDFALVLKRPVDVFVGVCAQYLIMPSLAFLLAMAFNLDPALTAGVVLVGTCPGGTSSNVITFMSKGDLALSVTMTSVSTLLSPILTPLITYQLIGQKIAFDPLGMFWSIIQIVIIPICLGLAVKSLLPKLAEQATDYLPAVAYVFVPFVLVMRQPDLGTSLVFAVITLGMLIISGFKMRWLAMLSGAFVVLLPAFWMILKEYQKNRIRVFLDPELDPFGAGYHVIQSKIAIGSGLLTGKGWFSGTQSQLNFLPENHTDFVFAVAGEEFGFIGVCVILFLYGIIIWRGLTIALNAEDDFGTLLAVGITFMFTFHMFVNIGMTAGIMPVTGIPLPFLSYGVSSLTTNMFLVGLLLNIRLRKQQLQF